VRLERIGIYAPVAIAKLNAPSVKLDIRFHGWRIIGRKCRGRIPNRQPVGRSSLADLQPDCRTRTL
jgi:hypothetical protein